MDVFIDIFVVENPVRVIEKHFLEDETNEEVEYDSCKAWQFAWHCKPEPVAKWEYRPW